METPEHLMAFRFKKGKNIDLSLRSGQEEFGTSYGKMKGFPACTGTESNLTASMYRTIESMSIF